MREIQAPNQIKWKVREELIFLAGSIEMGKAENWQEKIIKLLPKDPIVILNPRRDDWNSSWEQSIDNPLFSAQVNWELDAMEKAHIILMHFDPKTKSPITLLELGLFADSGKLIVHCPEGYWRKGNVDIVCQRYKIPQVQTLEELAGRIFRYSKKIGKPNKQ